MRRVAFLACAKTMPGAGERRGDAFEHDRMVANLRPAFAARGMELVEVQWDAPLEMLGTFEAALLGTSWDYHDRPAEFLARLEALEAQGIAVLNPPQVVRWNSDKRYLAEMADLGVATIPTIWFDDAGPEDIASAFDRLACDRLVVKRQVGAGAAGQFSFARDALPAPDWRMGHACMVQPFLPAIVSEGELTFVFIGGTLSHCLSKHAASGDYRIQSLFGGREQVLEPSASDLSQAQAARSALPFGTLAYCRIDMCRLPSGDLALMEAELIEPYLYPEQGPRLGELLAAEVAARLALSLRPDAVRD